MDPCMDGWSMPYECVDASSASSVKHASWWISSIGLDLPEAISHLKLRWETVAKQLVSGLLVREGNSYRSFSQE